MKPYLIIHENSSTCQRDRLRGVRQIFGGTVAGVKVLVGATLVVARVRLPTPLFAGTGRHKGVPYDGLGVVWR